MIVQAYLDQRTVRAAKGRVDTRVLVKDFFDWAEDRAPAGFSISSKPLGVALRDCGIATYRSSGQRYYLGIELKP